MDKKDFLTYLRLNNIINKYLLLIDEDNDIYCFKINDQYKPNYSEGVYISGHLVAQNNTYLTVDKCYFSIQNYSYTEIYIYEHNDDIYKKIEMTSLLG